MTEKPKTIAEYGKWLLSDHGISLDPADKNYYDLATLALLDHLRRSPFWETFIRELPELDSRYQVAKSVPLLMIVKSSPEPKTKPFVSMVDKSFRKNVLENDGWPLEPTTGWILPDDWLSQVNDVVRTYTVVKYLDGVTYLADALGALAADIGLLHRIDYEARAEGYYAAHFYVYLPAEIPRRNFDTRKLQFQLEIQITTQMQDVVRSLTHPFYVGRRSVPPDDPGPKWQWEYDSDEFKANYLAHTLHHMEGLMMDLRERGKSHGT